MRSVHARTVAGGAPGAALVFEATTRTGQEHGHRHWAHGSTGGAEPWLPPLPSPALIIVATAPYHNVLVEDTVPPPPRPPTPPGRRGPQPAPPLAAGQVKPQRGRAPQQTRPRSNSS